MQFFRDNFSNFFFKNNAEREKSTEAVIGRFSGNRAF